MLNLHILEFSTQQIHDVVRRYAEAVIAELPASPPLELQSQWHNPDGRLIRLLDFIYHDAPLRYCTRRQAQLLIHFLCGQASGLIKSMSSTGHEIRTGARTRPLTHTDLAHRYRLTARQIRSELERARRAVSRALSENWARSTQRRGGICCG